MMREWLVGLADRMLSRMERTQRKNSIITWGPERGYRIEGTNRIGHNFVIYRGGHTAWRAVWYRWCSENKPFCTCAVVRKDGFPDSDSAKRWLQELATESRWDV